MPYITPGRDTITAPLQLYGGTPSIPTATDTVLVASNPNAYPVVYGFHLWGSSAPVIFTLKIGTITIYTGAGGYTNEILYNYGPYPMGYGYVSSAVTISHNLGSAVTVNVYLWGRNYPG